MNDQPRPVWLTREQRDWLAWVAKEYEQDIVDAWDAAPADARQAIIVGVELRGGVWISQPMADAVLRALGMPS